MASDMSVAAPTYRAADMNLPLSTVEASSHTVSDLLGDFSYNQSQIHADIRALWQILRDEQSAPWIHWCNEGRSFCLVDDSEFVKGRLRFFFKKVTFRSFLRKFVNLGFTESLILPTPTDPRVWSVLTHEWFCRDSPELLSHISPIGETTLLRKRKLLMSSNSQDEGYGHEKHEGSHSSNDDDEHTQMHQYQPQQQQQQVFAGAEYRSVPTMYREPVAHTAHHPFSVYPSQHTQSQPPRPSRPGQVQHTASTIAPSTSTVSMAPASTVASAYSLPPPPPAMLDWFRSAPALPFDISPLLNEHWRLIQLRQARQSGQ